MPELLLPLDAFPVLLPAAALPLVTALGTGCCKNWGEGGWTWCATDAPELTTGVDWAENGEGLVKFCRKGSVYAGLGISGWVAVARSGLVSSLGSCTTRSLSGRESLAGVPVRHNDSANPRCTPVAPAAAAAAFSSITLLAVSSA